MSSQYLSKGDGMCVRSITIPPPERTALTSSTSQSRGSEKWNFIADDSKSIVKTFSSLLFTPTDGTGHPMTPRTFPNEAKLHLQGSTKCKMATETLKPTLDRNCCQILFKIKVQPLPQLQHVKCPLCLLAKFVAPWVLKTLEVVCAARLQRDYHVFLCFQAYRWTNTFLVTTPLLSRTSDETTNSWICCSLCFLFFLPDESCLNSLWTSSTVFLSGSVWRRHFKQISFRFPRWIPAVSLKATED